MIGFSQVVTSCSRDLGQVQRLTLTRRHGNAGSGVLPFNSSFNGLAVCLFEGVKLSMSSESSSSSGIFPENGKGALIARSLPGLPFLNCQNEEVLLIFYVYIED